MNNLHPIFQQIIDTMTLPKCGNCGEVLSVEEVADRNSRGIDVFDKDTICDICDALLHADFANNNFARKMEEGRI